MLAARNLSAPLAAALVVAGCAGPAPGAPEDRVNAAVPLPKSVVVAEAALVELASDAGDRAHIQSEIEAKLRVRALECARGYVPPLTATREEILAHVDDSDCFEKRDDKMAVWAGWRRVGYLVRMPPLRPVPKTLPPYITTTDYIAETRFPANAGVALLWTNQNLEIVELGTGRRILRLEGLASSQPGDLSPNGRVLAMATGASLSLLDAESGAALAQIYGIQPKDFFWLNDHTAMFRRLTLQQTVTVDFDTGEQRVVNVPKEPIVTATELRAEADAAILFSDQSVMKARIGRSLAEAPLTLLDQKPFQVQNWLRNGAVVTADGKYFVHAPQDLSLTSTTTLQTTTVLTTPFEIRIVTPLPDPDLILLSGSVLGVQRMNGWQHFVYSISKQTLAEVDATKVIGNRFVYLPAVNKIGIIKENRLVFADNLSTLPPVTLAQFVSRANDQQARQSAAAAALAPPAQLSGTGPVQVHTLPGARVIMRTSGDSWTINTTEAGGAPGEPIVEGIGIGQALNSVTLADGRKIGIAMVRVRPANGTPLILVLSSHEAVRWSVYLERGANVRSVLLAGPPASEVDSAESTTIVRIGAVDATQSGTPAYEKLQAEVARLTGRPIGRFQSAPVGGQFTVAGP